jgi:hypothetical protein
MRTAVIHAWLLAALAVGGQAAFAPRALAQGPAATLGTTAQVVAAGVVAGETPLTFGVVVPGVPKTVAATAATAARFNGVFPANSRLRLTLTLPTQLTSGANALPIGGWTALFSTTTSSAGATAISTTKATIVRVHPVTGMMNVFVGGSETPAGAQPSGVYVGVITLTAAFAGF